MNKILAAAAACLTLIAGACSSSGDSADPAESTTSSTTVTTAAPDVTTSARPAASTTTVPSAGLECVGDDWKMIDAGPLSFFVPADVIDQNAQGIDSLYGQFRGGGIDLAFDYGWFSPGLEEVERLGATVQTVSLGGVEGAFGTADTSGTDYDRDFITHLAVASIPSAEPSTLLWMGAGYDDAALTATAECIVATVRFGDADQPLKGEAPAEVTVERAADLGQIQPELAVGTVRLWISNQSFEDDPVVVSISVDGAALVEETLFVEGQHNWVPFDIAGLVPGEHSITATSSTGAGHVATFTLPEDEPRWLVLDYWFYPEDADGRFFSFTESDHAVAFA